MNDETVLRGKSVTAKPARATLATFARSMICPPSLMAVNPGEDLSRIGLADFDRYRYRHLSHFYRGDSECTEHNLLERIKAALEPAFANGRKPLLLLSDGKDSMALAVALAELGVSCTTLTLLRRKDTVLRQFVESVTSKLGHDPHFVTSDEALGAFDPHVLIAACGTMDTPVLDQGFLFFLFGMKLFFERSGLDPASFCVIDGLGNDEYFGYLPSRNQLHAYRLAALRLWKLRPDSLPTLRWYLRSPAEAQGDLSALSCFFQLRSAHDLNAYFRRVPRSLEPRAFVDFRAFSRGSFHDHQCMMGKTRAAAAYLGAAVQFPWLNPSLADYCFNLPVDRKFDFANLLNKLPLRQLLSRRFGWQQTKRGVDLFHDMDDLVFAKTIHTLVPGAIVGRIERSRIVNVAVSVRCRAQLELVNLFGYGRAMGMTDTEIGCVLDD